MTVIPFPRLLADTCRLHNRSFELQVQHLGLTIEPEPEPVRSFPTPFGWFLIGLAMIGAGRR
jgi:hypothetical protein